MTSVLEFSRDESGRMVSIAAPSDHSDKQSRGQPIRRQPWAAGSYATPILVEDVWRTTLPTADNRTGHGSI
jgi:hypothetical protein